MGRIRYVEPQFTPEARESLSALYPAITITWTPLASGGVATVDQD